DPLTAAQEVEVMVWKKAEVMAKYLLTQKLHDHTLIKVCDKVTVADQWAAICVEFMSKGEYTLTNACIQFLDNKCRKDADVQAFLNKLVAEHGCLSGMGVNIGEEDMCLTVIKSLPDYLSDFAAAQLTTACTIIQ
ncbi:hypothetical protein JAAARDRAFT_130480, partial [Jaapia argillacea MUCL 33604]